MSRVTIVMYHFVRDLKSSRYPKIKGLTIEEFKSQLLYLEKHYTFITIKDCIDAMSQNKNIPLNSILLTFDDAYIDHYLNVFPLLNEKSIQGCFFPPAKAIEKNEVLDVNKIHFVLASVPDVDLILNDIKLHLEEYKESYGLKSYGYYYNKLAVKSRYDSKEIIFIKRLLQTELCLELRGIITSSLFNKYVSSDEEAFSRELYMSKEHLKCMIRNGMYVGGHGYDHLWLNSLSEIEQTNQIMLTMEFLKGIGAPIDEWVMCYPYGAYDESLISILKQNNCKMALSTEVGIALLDSDNAYKIKRLDTNDLPKQSNASVSAWTLKVKP